MTDAQVVFRVDDRTIHIGHEVPKHGGWTRPVCDEGCDLSAIGAFQFIERSVLVDVDEASICPRLLERSIADRMRRAVADAGDAGITTQDIRWEST